MRAIILLAAVAAFATPTLADDTKAPKTQFSESTIGDINCLYVAISGMESTDPNQKQAGMMANLYWLGKLAAVDQNLTGVEDVLIADVTQITGGFFKKEAVRCGREMQTVGKKEGELGTDMVTRGERIQQLQ